MSSTRLNNDKGEYCQQQRDFNLSRQFFFDKNRIVPDISAFPCVGINMPKMNSGYNNNILSQNAADIESALLGIGSTNLVESKQPVVAKVNNMPSKKFFNRLETFIPEPLVVQKQQRPIGPFC